MNQQKEQGNSNQLNEMVSVVLCAYNGASFIAEQLKSICNQTYRNLEIIIVDDSSTDDTISVIEKQQNIDNRIKLYQNQNNLGYNKNFERAFQLATGSYIAIADQDDVWHTEKIAIMMNQLWQENTVLVHCASARFENTNAPKLHAVSLKNSYIGNDPRCFFLFNLISGHNIIFKSTLLTQLIPFPAGVYYDWWLNVVACCNGKINATDQVLVYQRMHDQNATVHNKKEISFRDQTLHNLSSFLLIPKMQPKDVAFGKTLVHLYTTLKNKSFSVSLFRFILQNASIIFSFKKRKMPWISYVKNAYYISRSAHKV
jgi:glycosyltransferase involved in cell wall biosynthesis